MDRIHTHYDNLKVTRNAPQEVIRAAYKSLVQKYHPDRHPGSADATRVMAIINGSYEVLSNPNSRREHDEWIAQEEESTRKPQPANFQAQPAAPQAPIAPQPASASYVLARKMGVVVSHLFKYWIVYLIGGVLINGVLEPTKSRTPSYSAPYQAAAPLDSSRTYVPPIVPTPSPVYAPSVALRPPPYVRPSTAPNGQAWPPIAEYVNGYQRLNTDGHSKVTVDNSRNDSDVFVKLVSDNGINTYPVRQFFIPAFGAFTLDDVTAGRYDVRYRDLNSGGLSRSESFTLEETTTYEGTRFSNLTMTLYKVKNGNMKTYDLTEAEFDK